MATEYEEAVRAESGTGATGKDEEKAARLYRLAADQGHEMARTALGRCYLLGKGVAKDEKEAVRMFRIAADKDVADAWYYLGWCYAHGLGVERDEG